MPTTRTPDSPRPEDLGPVAHRSEQRIDLPEPVAVDEVRQDAAQRRCGEGAEDDAEIAGTARGVATAARHQSAHTLERLIGTGRAALLRALERPATSSEPAVKLRQSLSTIGGHLAALRLTDLVVGTRVGRRVVYRRTEAGDNGRRNGATPRGSLTNAGASWRRRASTSMSYGPSITTSPPESGRT
ncbi:hypothetical protein San01_61070 [Streptomyces angustmyceticus]|uniref:HTH arsR-type domain-containing protein n=1 Tax=Streptomyces angustmyceticus TaxID=285578 RepID=A0A5J4LQ46_9ACTN|nr:hypothetical protein San01_61070 [Streptomyces angustmyceticus]